MRSSPHAKALVPALEVDVLGGDGQQPVVGAFHLGFLDGAAPEGAGTHVDALGHADAHPHGLPAELAALHLAQVAHVVEQPDQRLALHQVERQPAELGARRAAVVARDHAVLADDVEQRQLAEELVMTLAIEPAGAEVELVPIAAQAAPFPAGEHVVFHGGFEGVAPVVRQRVRQGGVGHGDEARRGRSRESSRAARPSHRRGAPR